MKIKDWENYIYNKYNAIKITDFGDLKKFTTNPMHYAHNFTPEEITEGEIFDEDFYAAYVFDENVIANRKTISKFDTCWNKLIIIISTKDNINITNYYIHTAGGLTDEESSMFYNDINPMQDSECKR